MRNLIVVVAAFAAGYALACLTPSVEAENPTVLEQLRAMPELKQRQPDIDRVLGVSAISLLVEWASQQDRVTSEEHQVALMVSEGTVDWCIRYMSAEPWQMSILRDDADLLERAALAVATAIGHRVSQNISPSSLVPGP